MVLLSISSDNKTKHFAVCILVAHPFHCNLLQNFKNLTFAEVAQLCKNDTTKVKNDFTYYMDKAKVYLGSLENKSLLLHLNISFLKIVICNLG